MDRLTFRARLWLLATEDGGRQQPILRELRPSWNLGNTWLGRPTNNDGRVVLDAAAELHPGDEADVRIEPLVEELWGQVLVGSVIPMHEGRRVVGHARIVEVSRPAFLTPEVAAFVSQARQFCELIETASERTLAQRLTGARARLLELYRAAVALPDVEVSEGFDEGRTPGPPEGWPGFGDLETYWEVFDPYEEDTPVAGSLSDDLLDIYRDVRRGLALWEVARAAAIWEWRFHFDRHWGDHAVDALRALHRACARHGA